MLLLLILYHHQYLGGYHDPVAAGQWSNVPLRLLSSLPFDPAGRPCLPPHRDSVITLPPDRKTQMGNETQHVRNRNQTKTLCVISVCVCVFLCSLGSALPSNGHVSQHWRVGPRPACCLGPQQPPGPTTACRQPACHFLLLLSELTGRQKEGGSLTIHTSNNLGNKNSLSRSQQKIFQKYRYRILTKWEVVWENKDYLTDWLSRSESMNEFLKENKQLGRDYRKTEANRAN